MDKQNPVRIIIVDDHAMLRKGLAIFLTSYDDLQLVGEAANGEEAVTLCAETHPDVILMDLMMPVMNGITATRHIHANHPEIQIIILTSFGEEMLIKDALEAGATSYLFKKILADDLAKAIRAAKEGFSTFAPEVTNILVQSIKQPHTIFEDLTPRERDVLALIVKGMGNHEIANTLVIGLSTTKSHVANILGKLGAASRLELIAMVMEHNYNLGAFYID